MKQMKSKSDLFAINVAKLPPSSKELLVIVSTDLVFESMKTSVACLT